MNLVRVLLVESHEMARQGIKSLLETEPWITVCGEATHGAEALKAVSSTDPDVIVIDVNAPAMTGIDCTRRLKYMYSDKKVVVLTMHDNESSLLDMLDAGADGYVFKRTNKDELLYAIKKVANDGIYIGQEFTLSLLAKFRNRSTRHEAAKDALKLTQHEMEVLERIGRGKTNAEIAQELFTSVRTIETRRKNLLDKTGTTNTATLIRYAVLNGLVN
jgi:DNA-binding NarL/FixJ family response regulator